MEFHAGDTSALPEPSTAELRAWYARNPSHFAEPGRGSFRHVYFSTDRRGSHAREDAVRSASRLAGKPSGAPVVSTIGDRVIFQVDYADCQPVQSASIFGGSLSRE